MKIKNFERKTERQNFGYSKRYSVKYHAHDTISRNSLHRCEKPVLSSSSNKRKIKTLTTNFRFKHPSPDCTNLLGL